MADDWDERPHRIEDIQEILQTRKEAALKRERALSYAFSSQVKCLRHQVSPYTRSIPLPFDYFHILFDNDKGNKIKIK